MKWQNLRRSGHVIDHRGGASRGVKGGLGLGGLAVVLIGSWLLGINPLTVLSALEGSNLTGPEARQPTQNAPSNDQGSDFVRAILGDLEDVWSTHLLPQRYQPPKLVLFQQSTSSACGFASAAMGPFYCPANRQVYLDLGFFQDLRQQYQAGGDFAEAYVIAHEVGHHVQTLLGTSAQVRQRQAQAASKTQANQWSVALELQADCYAGLWGHYAAQRGLLEQGDLEEALRTAAEIGDDRLQKRSQGYVVPESFTHGSAAQRQHWFQQGFSSGQLKSCNTFAS